MMSIEEFQYTIAETLCQGNMNVAGLLMLAVVMLLILSISRRIYTSIILMLPVAIVFWLLDIIGTDMMVILVIAAMLGLVLYSKVSVGIDWDPFEGRDRWGRQR